MTQRQRQLLLFIKSYYAANGRAPSYREMAAGIGLSDKSKSTVQRLVHALARDGHLTLAAQGRRQVILVCPLANIASSDLTDELARRGSAVHE